MEKYRNFIFFVIIITVENVYGLFEFPKVPLNIPPDDAIKLSNLKSKLELAVQMGMDSYAQQERLEINLLQSQIVVQNGTISHAQFLETYPNDAAKNDDRIARKILKSSLYLVNSECKRLNVNSDSCAQYLSQISLPTSTLKDECLKAVETISTSSEGHDTYRRLLPPNYKDGIYEMWKYPNVPSPREITRFGLYRHHDSVRNGNIVVDETKNLILVQWSQFIEHDISKLAVTTMSNGSPIECCNTDFFKLTPRYVHPACAQLEDVANNSFARVPCLNYVRSSLAINSRCKFGPAQQLNQATSSLDLSQLYGYTEESRNQMRAFVDGELKTSSGNLLPLAEDKEKFCVTNDTSSDELCFMAGDNRVNSNPFVTILYTIFLRLHNTYAKQLKLQNPDWNDEKLFSMAKKMNIDTYRCIIFNEWLPNVLGEDVANIINTEPIIINHNEQYQYGVSNEFAIAAIRFYYSMMPNALYGTQNIYQNIDPDNMIDITFDDKSSNNELFSLQDEYYKSNFLSNPQKLSIALEAMLNQRAMKMDLNYAESLTKHFLKTTSSSKKISGTDALAWDIQRGRDHGLAGYIRYLEICTNSKIMNWSDLEKYMNNKNIEKLKSIYNNVEDIDLIVGGITEKPALDSILGPTFTCILGEQFSNIRKTQFLTEKLSSSKNSSADFNESNEDTFNPETVNCKASKLLCETTSLNAVPKNIFMAPSQTNPIISCSDL